MWLTPRRVGFGMSKHWKHSTITALLSDVKRKSHFLHCTSGPGIPPELKINSPGGGNWA